MNYLLKLCSNNLTSLLEEKLVLLFAWHSTQEVGQSCFQLSSNPVVLVEKEGVDGSQGWLNNRPCVPRHKILGILGTLRSEPALSSCWQRGSSCFVGQQLTTNMAPELVRSLHCWPVDIGAVDIAGNAIDLVLVVRLIWSLVLYSVRSWEGMCSTGWFVLEERVSADVDVEAPPLLGRHLTLIQKHLGTTTVTLYKNIKIIGIPNAFSISPGWDVKVMSWSRNCPNCMTMCETDGLGLFSSTWWSATLTERALGSTEGSLPPRGNETPAREITWWYNQSIDI